MIRLLRPFLIAILVLAPFAPTSSVAQIVSFDALLAEAEIAGMAVVSVKDGAVSDVYYGGVRSTETNPPVTAATVFEAESLSKPVMAYIALKLVGEKVLDLDKPLSEYASYPDAADDTRYMKITARMVLTHTSGFPNWRTDRERVPVLYEPGTTFSYSGEGFVFLQRIIEHLTYQSLEALAQSYVFEPLGMTSSSFTWQSSFAQNIAVGHTDIGIALDKFTPQVGNAAYSLHTTAEDYARFMLAMARGEGLSKSLTRDLSTIQVDAGDGIFWGLGWGLQPSLDGASVWHWGDNPGYKSFAFLSPDAKNGFVLLSNSANGMLLLSHVFEALIGGPQTAVNWLNYERFDDPQYQLGKKMHYALLSGGMDEAKAVYEGLKDSLPAEAYEEPSLNSLGYRLLRQGMIDHAVSVLEFNAELFPRSANVHDSLGEAYYSAGRLEEALVQYRASLRIDPLNQSGSSMIRAIEAAISARDRQ
jgi:CubicO group peptidase (beta-lactamase class C family)